MSQLAPRLVVANSLIASASAISATMLPATLGSRALPGCGKGSGCDLATASRWAKVGFVPVTILGMIVYLVTMLVSIGIGFGEDLFPYADTVRATLPLVIIGSAIWFTVVQAVMLKRWCVYCAFIHIFAASGATTFHRVILRRHGCVGRADRRTDILGTKTVSVGASNRIGEACGFPAEC
jgi:uncharacterized membrane protein